MQVILTGGQLGGQVVEWPNGEIEATIDGHVYRLDGEQAIYVGDANA